MAAVEVLADLGSGFLGRSHADLRMGAGAQALGRGDPELDAAVRLGEGELLGVGVGDDELDALEPRLDHVVDGVATCAPDSEHDDPRLQLSRARRRKMYGHGDPSPSPESPATRTPSVLSGWLTRRPPSLISG